VDLQPEEYEFWLFQQPELKPARNTDGRNAARSACGWCSFAAVAAFAFGVIHTLIGVDPPSSFLFLASIKAVAHRLLSQRTTVLSVARCDVRWLQLKRLKPSRSRQKKKKIYLGFNTK
jgi:hypothetical protein